MNFLKTLATISSMTFLSRILGFVRDFVIARLFGASIATDAFFVAFRLPNLLRRMFAEGAFSQAFVPILSEYKNKRPIEETQRLIDHVATLLGLALVIVTALGILASPFLITLTAPGFSADKEKFDLTVQLTRITFPYILFISLVSLAGGILNTWRKFAIPAFTPVLLNLSFIVMALFAAPLFQTPVLALAWAVFIGGVLQLALQVPYLKKLGLLPRFSINLHDPAVRRILKLMLPALLGVSVSQISLVINTVFASFLPHGSVSWLYYADRLMEFPSGLLGVALGTILLPSLSKCYADEDATRFSALLDMGLRLTFILSLPAALALALLAWPLLLTLFQHGAFSVQDVLQTQTALVAYSVGLVGLILVKVLAPGFYARQDIRTPVKIALITLAATQLMNFVFIIPFKHAGLALSIGLASCLNSGLLFRKLRQHGIYHAQPGWAAFIFKLAVALIALGITLWFGIGGINQQENWLHYHSLERVIRLSIVILAGIIVYGGVLWSLGFRIKDFTKHSL